MSNARATEATGKLTKPEGTLGDGGSPASLFDKVYARCYDRFMDRIDGAGAAEHRRRLVEEAAGEVLEIGAGTGKNLLSIGPPSGWWRSSPTLRCGRGPTMRRWRLGFP